MNRFPDRLAFFQGNLAAILSETQDLSNFLWCAMHTADHEFCCKVFDEILGGGWHEEVDHVWRNRIKVLNAICLYSQANIAKAYQTLKEIDQDALRSQESGIWRSFYLSNFVHLVTNLQDTDLPFSGINPSSAVVPVVGDSHTLTAGWVDVSGWIPKPVYLPGIQLMHLADPKSNIFKEGLKNACTMSSKNSDVIFMIGEIDYRITETRKLASSKIIGKPQGELINIQKQVAADAISSIASQKAPDQNYFVCSVQPPNPILFKNHETTPATADFEINLIAEVNASIEEKCKEKSINFVDRSTHLASDDGFLRDNAFLDGKHLKRMEHQAVFKLLR